MGDEECRDGGDLPESYIVDQCEHCLLFEAYGEHK